MVKRIFLMISCSALLFGGCVSERYLTTEDGLKLAYQHRKAQSEKGTVLLIHGLGSSYEEWRGLAGFLNKNGWSTLAIDLRGHGSSLDWNGEEIDWHGFSPRGFLSMAYDVDAAVKLVGTEKPLWMIGSSMGANLALFSAVKEPGVRGLVLLSPGFSYGGIRSAPLILSYGARPLLVAGSEDDVGTLKLADQILENAQGPKKLIRYKDAGHGAAMLDFEKNLKKEILAWIDQQTT